MIIEKIIEENKDKILRNEPQNDNKERTKDERDDNKLPRNLNKYTLKMKC